MLLVLVSGAVLWVVDGEQDKPTSEAAEVPSASLTAVVTADDEVLATTAYVSPLRPRQPATSRRVGPAPAAAVEEPMWREPAVVPSAPARAIADLLPAVRTLDPPLPRHRVRSALLLVALVVAAGALLAGIIGIVVSALAFALRAAVTS